MSTKHPWNLYSINNLRVAWNDTLRGKNNLKRNYLLKYYGTDCALLKADFQHLWHLEWRLSSNSAMSCFNLPQLSVKNCFIRGSVVRYVQLPADEVDTQLLQDAARKEAMQQKQWSTWRMGLVGGWGRGVVTVKNE